MINLAQILKASLPAIATAAAAAILVQTNASKKINESAAAATTAQAQANDVLNIANRLRADVRQDLRGDIKTESKKGANKQTGINALVAAGAGFLAPILLGSIPGAAPLVKAVCLAIIGTP